MRSTDSAVTYARFADDVLPSNPFLAKLIELFDSGRIKGRADLETLREINPDLLSFRSWLAGSGRKAFTQALGASGRWDYGNA
jgi:hypothetical protein